MLVKESMETAFGTPIKGVTIQLTEAEAKMLCPALLQAIANPSKARDGMNTDWDAKDFIGKLYNGIRRAIMI